MPPRAPSHAKVEAADARQVGRHGRDIVSALELAVFEYLGRSNTGRPHRTLEDVPSVELDALSDQRNVTELEPPNPGLRGTPGLIPPAPPSSERLGDIGCISEVAANSSGAVKAKA